MLYFFDFKKRKFFYCNLEFNRCSDWLSKDLPIAYEPDGQITLPHFKSIYQESQGELYSYELISREQVMIIGGHNPFYCCIEYNFVTNTLKTKSFDFDAKARPILKYAN